MSGNVAVPISNYAYHPATSNNSAFDTGTVKPGQSATVALTKSGTYVYYCQFHAFMHGTLVVK